MSKKELELYERTKSLFESRGCKLLTKEIKRAISEVEYLCLEHPEKVNTVRIDNFMYIKKYNCDKCRIEQDKLKMINKYSKLIKNDNIKIVDYIRENSSSYLIVKCLKHHNKETKVDTRNFKTQKYHCRNCASDVNSKNRRHSIEHVEKIFNDKNLIVYNSNEYENNQTELIYSCMKHPELGKQKTNFANVNCATPCRKCGYELISGDNHYYWKGGVSPLHTYMRDKISQWKSDSLKFYDYKCVITSTKKDLVVHHTYNFSDILNETLNDLNLEVKKIISLYSDDELKQIEKLLIKKHYEYGLGMPLNTLIHDLYHKVKGRKNNTYKEFEDFKNEYLNGDYGNVI